MLSFVKFSFRAYAYVDAGAGAGAGADVDVDAGAYTQCRGQRKSLRLLHNIEQDLVMQGGYKYTALININNK